MWSVMQVLLSRLQAHPQRGGQVSNSTESQSSLVNRHGHGPGGTDLDPSVISE